MAATRVPTTRIAVTRVAVAPAPGSTMAAGGPAAGVVIVVPEPSAGIVVIVLETVPMTAMSAGRPTASHITAATVPTVKTVSGIGVVGRRCQPQSDGDATDRHQPDKLAIHHISPCAMVQSAMVQKTPVRAIFCTKLPILTSRSIRPGTNLDWGMRCVVCTVSRRSDLSATFTVASKNPGRSMRTRRGGGATMIRP